MSLTPSTAGAPESAPVRVMLVDDSAVMRNHLRRLLEPSPGLKIVATASNGATALEQLNAVAPDVVVLDLDMPVMDGLTALPLIMKQRPDTRVIVASTLSQRNAAISLKALSLGAADYVPKPSSLSDGANANAFRDELEAKVRGVAKRPTAVSAPPTVERTRRPVRTEAPEVIAIGSSTGGPPALMELFAHLKGVTQAILVTQHMPPTFTAMLAETLGRISGRPSGEAQQGERIMPGRIYVAPSGMHLTVEKRRDGVFVVLSDAPPENFCKPAVDPMFRSLADAYGANVFGLILTGMGSDGAKGCEALAKAGGRFIVQDEATSVVWGMPGAAARTGLAEAILPLRDIAPFLCRVAMRPAR